MKLSFEGFVFSGETRQLLRGDVEVHVSPKAFDLLRMLIEARPKALSKNELTERLWPSTFVGDANLSVLVAEIRAALGDSARTPRFIRTVQRYGYAFCGRMQAKTASSASLRRSLTCWLVSGAERTPLATGVTIIGRDPVASVWLDLPGVSRQHARIVVTAGRVTVADLESKNGTYVRGRRIDSIVNVGDGDEIRVGPVAFTLRILSAIEATQTG